MGSAAYSSRLGATVQRLTGADATFLYSQTSRTPMEICSTIVLDPSTAPHDFTYERSLEWLEQRLHLARPLRRRLVQVPLGLDHPVWIEDPAFDLRYHVRRAALPSPGGMAELGDFVAQVMSRPLDLSRPLWEQHLVEGLEGDRIAVVTKAHHAAIDGVAGMEMMASLVDLSADSPQPPPPAVPWRPDLEPSQAELVVGAMGGLMTQPLRAAKVGRRLVRSIQGSRRQGGDITQALGGASGAPPTPFNRTVSSQRTVRFFSLPLEEVKAVKQAAGVKLNDIVLGMLGGGLRSYLERGDALPDEPLLAFVPMSTREGTEAGPDGGNETSLIFVTMGTDEKDPLARVRAIHEAAAEAKAAHAETGPPVLTDLADLTGPAMAMMTGRILERARLNERFRMGGNVVVSNIPGAPIPLYIDGATVESVFPLGPITDGNGLNVTLFSYLDQLGFGVVACPKLVPDLDVLVEDLQVAWADLVAATST